MFFSTMAFVDSLTTNGCIRHRSSPSNQTAFSVRLRISLQTVDFPTPGAPPMNTSFVMLLSVWRITVELWNRESEHRIPGNERFEYPGDIDRSGSAFPVTTSNLLCSAYLSILVKYSTKSSSLTVCSMGLSTLDL